MFCLGAVNLFPEIEDFPNLGYVDTVAIFYLQIKIKYSLTAWSLTGGITLNRIIFQENLKSL